MTWRQPASASDDMTHHPKQRLARIVTCLSFCLATAMPVLAQTDPVFGAAGFQQNRDYFSAGPTEHVDTLTGNLILTYTDLVLPGNAGHDVRFQRTYNANTGQWTVGVVPFIEHRSARFPGVAPDYPPIFVDASGAEHPTRRLSALDSTWVASEDFWKYDSVNRVLYLPDGSTVRYGPCDAPSYSPCFQPLQSRDAFGNEVNASYGVDAVTGEDVTIITQKFGTSQREVTLKHPSGNRHIVRSMTFLDRVWTYTATASSLTVTPPVGPAWEYAYVGTPASGPAPCSLPPVGNGTSVTVTTPQGGTVHYDFAPHSFRIRENPDGSSDCYIAAALTGRHSGGRGVTAGDWTYDYTFDDGPHSYVTTLASPDGSITQFTYGTAYMAGEPAFAAEGPSLIRRTVRSGPSAPPIEEEALSYRVLPVPGGALAGTAAVRLGRRTLTRDGRSRTTTYDFAKATDGSFLRYGDYHRPNRIEEVGEMSRATDRTFSTPWYPFDALVTPPAGSASFLGAVETETVTVGAKNATRLWAHDANTGFTTEETRYGVVTEFTADAFGNVASVTKANGVSTTFEYQWGVVRTIVTAAHTTTRTINEDSTVASEEKGPGTAHFVYDALSRIISSDPPGTDRNDVVTNYGDGTYVTVRRGDTTTTTTLDGFGRPTRVDAPGASTTTTYDAMGRPTFESYPFVGATPLGTTLTYDDALGRVTRRTNPDSTYVEYTYGAGEVAIRDEAGRITRQTWEAFGSPDEARLASVSDASGNDWTYEYNLLGTLTRVGAPGGVERRWNYADAARPERLTSETHPESGTIAYTEYDPAGNLTRRVDAKNTLFQYEYDSNDRLVRTTAGTRVTTFTYEAGTDHRKTGVVDGVRTTWSYDDGGRVRARVDEVPEAWPLTQSFTYDGNDNLKTITYATGRRIEYTYDAANRVTSVTDVSGAPKVHASLFTYHPSGAITSYRTLDNVVHTVEYHPQRYWPTRIRGRDLDLTYGNYDAVGNVGTITDVRGASWGQTFQYDALDRLTQAVGPYGTAQYAYDPHGNRQSNPPYGTYEYVNFRLMQQGDSSGTQSFTYDANGNLKTGTYQGATYDYTPDNQLESSTVGGVEATYQYDVDGWRLATTVSGSRTLFARGVGGQLMSEIQSLTARDYLYAGTRLIGVVGATGLPSPDRDTTPDAFGGVNQTGVLPGVVVDSTIVRITGLTDTASTWISGAGTYRICSTSTCSDNLAFSAGASTITNGAYLQWRVTSSAALGTAVTTLMSVGQGAEVWTVTTTATPDATPDPFVFTPQTGVAVTTTIDSNIVQATGLAGTVTVSVSGAGAYRVCATATCSTNPPFVTAPQTFTNTAYVQLRAVSSGTPGMAVTTTLTVGTGSSTWTVTTTGPDLSPNPFDFTDQTNVAPSTFTFSNILQITGITGNAPTSISQAAYRVCANATCSAPAPPFITGASTITNGQYLQIRMFSAANFSTTINITMTVGTGTNSTNTWSVTTAAQDITPNTFTFPPQTGVPFNTQISSSIVQVTGITGNVATSVAGTGVEYRVCADATCTAGVWTAAAATIANGQYVQMKILSSGLGNTTTGRTLTVGSYATTWSVTTGGDPCGGSPAPGTTCGDGSKFAGYSPASGTKMYTTPADWGWLHFAWPETLWGGTNNVDGRANTNGLAPFGNYAAANACYYLSAHGKDDWYLPAPDEWNTLDPHRNAIGGFEVDETLYWTSAEADGGSWFGGIYHSIGSSFNGYTGQGVALAIRCVRRD